MSETPQADSKPRLKPYQFSLRFLFALTAVVAVLVSAPSWLPPSQSSQWGHDLTWAYPPPDKCYYAGGFSINDWEPTIGYFVRLDRKSQSEETGISWLNCDCWRVRVNGRRVPHLRRKFQLFVDDGSGCPVRVILDRADARKYFDPDNVFFDHWEAGDEFWNEIILKKYGLYPESAQEE